MSTPEKVATKLVKQLFDAGFTAFFAGGWVRDMLRGEATDEVDIATSAPPEKVLSLFPKTIPVGVAFGVVIVVMEGVQFEVSTFRRDHSYHDGRHPEGVDYSTPEIDAKRRDFTINGMFYDPLTQEIHDYVGGQEDLKRGVIRAIGNPEKRFEEDRLRMLRAARFSARFQFPIDSKTEEAIVHHAHTLFPAVSIERVWQEFVKMSAFPHFDQALVDLHRLGLLQTVFPELENVPLKTIEKRLAPLPYFSPDTPTIVILLQLFPSLDFDLCARLKLSNAEAKLIAYFEEGKTLLAQKEHERAIWAKFYAHPYTPLFLNVEAAKCLPPGRQNFLEEHTKRQKTLRNHIERIQTGRPLVTSAHLKKRGIEPGKKMGELLREAERIAINNDLSDPEIVLAQLIEEG